MTIVLPLIGLLFRLYTSSKRLKFDFGDDGHSTMSSVEELGQKLAVNLSCSYYSIHQHKTRCTLRQLAIDAHGETTNNYSIYIIYIDKSGTTYSLRALSGQNLGGNIVGL